MTNTTKTTTESISLNEGTFAQSHLENLDLKNIKR